MRLKVLLLGSCRSMQDAGKKKPRLVPGELKQNQLPTYSGDHTKLSNQRAGCIVYVGEERGVRGN